MTAVRSHHAKVFAQLVAQRRADLLESLAGGYAIDFAAYRQRVGELQGLADALKLSEEADFNISGDEPDAGA